MKALVLEEYGRFVYDDVPDPVAEAGEVVVEVRACGICGSDVHGMDGSTGRRRPPIVMGHEASGVIASLGKDVGGWNPGDRVTFDSTVYCGECWFCRRNEVNLCDNRRVLGVSCADYRREGAFAERVVIPARILYRLPEETTFEQAAMAEAVSVAVHAVGRWKVDRDATSVVVGAGMIGLLVVQALRAAGCGRIVAVDLDDDRLAVARELGADYSVRADAGEIASAVKGLSHGRGADASFEVVGNSAALRVAIGCLRKGGTLVLVGNLQSQVELPLQDVVTRQLSLLGSCASSGEYTTALELMAQGKIDVSPLISAVAPLSEGAGWFQRLYAKEPGLMKVILRP
jgi:L-iditol 2-dehydrogenase